MNSIVTPKIKAVDSALPLCSSEAFGMLTRFLKAEHQKQDPVSLQQSHWEELYRVAETMVDTDAPANDHALDQQQTLRQLRLMVAPISSPGALGFAQEGTTTTRPRSDSSNLIPVDHTSSIKKEVHSADDKSAKKAIRKEKKDKKSKKKEKKRKYGSD